MLNQQRTMTEGQPRSLYVKRALLLDSQIVLITDSKFELDEEI